MAAYGSAGQFDDLERWGRYITATNHLTEDPKFQLPAAMAAVHAMIAYGSAGRFADLERWGVTLTCNADRFPMGREIQMRMARAAVNAIHHYASARKFDELKQWEAAINVTASRFSDDCEIQLEFSKAAVTGIAHYGSAHMFDDLNRWGKALTATFHRFAMDHKIGLRMAKGAVNAINAYGSVQQFHDLELWGASLRAVADRFPQAREIQRIVVDGAVRAIYHYGSAQKSDGLDRWKPIAFSAIRRSDATTDFINSVIGSAAGLAEKSSPAAAALFDILNDYWPGFLIAFSDGSHVPLCLLPWPQRRAGTHQDREALTKAHGFASRLFSGTITIPPAEAAPLLRELWLLRMYLPDRGDALVPHLAASELQDLVAEAARDPWRSPGAST